MTLYDIKPRFQALLRPLVKQLAGVGVTANQVTLAAAFGSVVLGIVLLSQSHHFHLFLLLPLWMFVRMALNAIDGMLAREFKQQSKLGAYLNELCDVIADAALYLPFAFIPPFSAFMVVFVIFLAMLSEFTGVLGLTVGASRRYDGPLGKSDRAFIFGALGLWMGWVGKLPNWIYWLMPLLAILLGITIINRIRRALSEADSATSG